MNRPPPWSSLRARSVSSFCDFRKKLPFVIKPYCLLFEARIPCVFLIFLSRNIKAYLCPNMINFNAMDFSERRPEEVMFLLTLSVFTHYTHHTHIHMRAHSHYRIHTYIYHTHIHTRAHSHYRIHTYTPNTHTHIHAHTHTRTHTHTTHRITISRSPCSRFIEFRPGLNSAELSHLSCDGFCPVLNHLLHPV